MGHAGHLSLGRKIALTVLGFSLVPLFALGMTMYGLLMSAYESKTQANLVTLAENKKQSIDLFLRDQVSQLRTLLNSHSIEDLSSSGAIDHLLVQMQANSEIFIDLGLIDNQGSHVAYSGPYTLADVNYSKEHWFHEVMIQKVFISDVFEGFRGFPHMIIAVTKYEKGQLWILRATINSEIFDSLVRWLHLGDQGDAYLVNREGRLQTHPRFGQKDARVFASLASSPFSGVRVQQYTGDRHRLLVSGIWLEQKNWLLVIEENVNAELQLPAVTRRLTWLVLACGIAVIVVGTLLITKMLVAQQERHEREQGRLNSELVQSGKMAALGKLAAGVAHEVNNPLAVIREKAGWMQDLLDEEDIQASPSFQEFSDAVQKIELHVQRASTVVHRMLGFARRMEPARDEIFLNELVQQTVVFFENELHFRQIALHLMLEESLPAVFSDAAQIQQVILNLVNNAIDSLGKGGTLWISTNLDKEQRACISIKDDGPGIDKDVQKHIFDPFFTTKKVGEGTGLGLSISYSIVSKLGGTLRFHSEPGHGAEFIIALPVTSHAQN